ncbi:MAG: ORF6N domain-containing protein [Firmicutes bacterium]|nr:ORF6N domain-containing protein [Bacillota bacterium]
MEELIISDIKIEDMIYEIRGKQVMLDRDLAKEYGVETKVFMQNVKRNIERFPENFMFQLTKEEFMNWRSQFVTSNNDLMGLRRPPYAFTEQGVAMLSGILKSKIAINTSIKIINAFVSMRHYLIENKDVYKSLNNINNKLIEHDDKLDYLFSKFDKKERLYLSGEEYDIYSDIKETFSETKGELIVIDNYADKVFLDLIRNINVNIVLITKNNSKLTKTDTDKYNKQYKNLKVIYTDKFHDRYFIIDRKIIYHSGTSINFAGNKVTSINKLEDNLIKNQLLKFVIKLIEK